LYLLLLRQHLLVFRYKLLGTFSYGRFQRRRERPIHHRSECFVPLFR
jgi:hypothetical protein